jgi:hypothetical protein
MSNAKKDLDEFFKLIQEADKTLIAQLHKITVEKSSKKERADNKNEGR